MVEALKDMAIQKRIKAVIQFRRGTEQEWINVNPTPRIGEPCFSTDVGRVKIGDGEKKWSELDYIGGEGTDFYIEDPEGGQILLYNAETERWENYNLADEDSIIYLTDKGLSLKGYKEATQGQMLVKDTTLGLAWVNPLSDATLQEAVQQANDAASRASGSAITAGNYAGQAIQAAAEVQRKFWYGTMDEYNALQTIYRDTIYVILHE